MRIGGDRLEKKWRPGSKKLAVIYFGDLSFYYDIFSFYKAFVIIEQRQ